ncbi:MAG TPA: isoprenylcysteine carboxylmethyltransferase family protein [Gammaproteobacteria bacterium]|nr:isoprenylcysteine carboxylmethyltransferase family protein [Gammaproteobacteria bacterium]
MQDASTPPSDPHGPGVRIHPPLIYTGSILVGIGIDHLWTLPMPFGLHGPLYTGIILALVLALAGLCILEFYKAGTDVRPDRPDSALITSGPYCRSRNPLYIGLTLVQVAAAVWLDNTWVLAMSVVSVIVITGYAIRREERYLERRFGDAYLDYKRRVRRWI